jgi:hypothetical protein
VSARLRDAALWLRADLNLLTSNGIPLCTAAAKLTVRRPTESESQVYRDADRGAQASDDLLLAYLVELDESGSSDEPKVKPAPEDSLINGGVTSGSTASIRSPIVHTRSGSQKGRPAAVEDFLSTMCVKGTTAGRTTNPGAGL